MPRTDAATLGGWLRDAERSLARAGVESPRHDAERLAAHGLGIAWGDLWARLRDDVAHDLSDLLRRRCDGEPLAYITGSVVFRGLELLCGPGVLVPRPETQTLVDVALELIAGARSPLVLDIGTGSAAVAIAIACARPDATVIATDVSSDALCWASRNIQAAGVNVQLARGDLFDAVDPQRRGRVHLVVSNPPYIADGVALPPDVEAEPAQALRAGPRGDEVLMRIADEAPEWLAPDGALALEVGTPQQAVDLERHLSRWARAGVRADDTSRPRVVWARR